MMIRRYFKFLKKTNRNYISDIDKFLYSYDKKNPQRSEAQRQEIAKHRNIFESSANKTNHTK